MSILSEFSNKAAGFFKAKDRQILFYAGAIALFAGCLELLLVSVGYFTKAANLPSFVTAAMGFLLLVVWASEKNKAPVNEEARAAKLSPTMRSMGKAMFPLLLGITPFMLIPVVNETTAALQSGVFDTLVHTFFTLHSLVFAIFMSAGMYRFSTKGNVIESQPA